MNKPRSDLTLGDCRECLPTLAEVDAIITDPPYELGFMGKQWDNSGIAYDVDMWRECLRVLKPGGYLLAFGGTRTQHRMVCAIEDAGFEIRDTIMWLYGSGFPKSLDIGKSIDKAAGAERTTIATRHKRGAFGGVAYAQDQWTLAQANQPLNLPITAPATDAAKQWDGWHTALKPAHEPICVARKPLAESTVAANVLKYGAGAINVDGCRIEGSSTVRKNEIPSSLHKKLIGHKNQPEQQYITGSAQGRWPANVLHDDSDEVHAAFDVFGDAARFFKACPYSEEELRFFYTGKATATDRGTHTKPALPLFDVEEETFVNDHATVKPLALMRYLITLVTPPGGIVLDPFLGSGTTAVACMQLNVSCIGIEIDEKHLAIARERVKNAPPIKPAVKKRTPTPRQDDLTL